MAWTDICEQVSKSEDVLDNISVLLFIHEHQFILWHNSNLLNNILKSIRLLKQMDSFDSKNVGEEIINNDVIPFSFNLMWSTVTLNTLSS